MSDERFGEFVRRIRAGDQQAAADLVRQYEPLIRREIRLGLTEPSLRRALDSMDICQSVMASFFVQAACGRYYLAEPRQVINLLIGMARNKLAFAVRKERAQRRDLRRVDAIGVDELNPADSSADTPSQIVAGRELLCLVRERLSEEERQVAERRARGQDWAGIAAEMGGTAEGRRHQLTRALDRVVQELKLNDLLPTR
jgi:RNA polymerase sigma-70 factor (ECF subfamily)